MACRIDIGFSIFSFIVISAIVVGLVFSVFAIVFDCSAVKFHVVNASLTQFNLTTTANNRNILAYNLTLDVELRNPSKTFGIRYRRIRAAATYKGRRFAIITFPPFYQGHKNTTVLHPLLFQGEALDRFKNFALNGFNKDQRLGRFDIKIVFNLDLMVKLGSLKLPQVRTMLCDLELPLGSYNDSSAAVGGFMRKKCRRKRAKQSSF